MYASSASPCAPCLQNFESGFQYDYGYNHRNALTSVDYTEATTDTYEIEYTYDVLGRRIAQAVTDLLLSNTETTRYVYDGFRVIEERGSNDELMTPGDDDLLAEFLFGNYIDDVLQMRCYDFAGSSGARRDYNYLRDDQYSIIALQLFDGSADPIVERVRYDAFGKPTFINEQTGTETSASQYGNTFAFQGRKWDALARLYHYRLRAYDPATGQFLQKDPIGIWGDLINRGNGYTIVGNGPWVYLDPYGEEACVTTIATATTLGTTASGGSAAAGLGGAAAGAGPAAAVVGTAVGGWYIGSWLRPHLNDASESLGEGIGNWLTPPPVIPPVIPPRINPVRVLPNIPSNTGPVTIFPNSPPANTSPPTTLTNPTTDITSAPTLPNIPPKIDIPPFCPASPIPDNLGDLTAEEIKAIQDVVDAALRPLDVVGSAAEGNRRNPTSNFPIGKGEGTRSDIDYLVGPSSLDYFMDLQYLLPSIDPVSGIIPGNHNPFIGPSIRFEPGTSPKKID